MKKRTLKYTILLLLISQLPFCVPVMAQQNGKDIKADEEQLPFYRGATVSVDLFGVGSKLLGGDFLSTEIGLDVNLKNKYFPVFELGFGTTDATEDTYYMHYKSSAPYARIGLNYNMMAKKNSNSFLFLGVRYAIAPSLKYDVYGPDLVDGVWGGEVPLDLYGEKSSAQWGEFLVGIKVEVYKRFLMGWTLRYKARFNVEDNPNSTPWYIPGYGKNRSTVFDFTYNLIYVLPF